MKCVSFSVVWIAAAAALVATNAAAGSSTMFAPAAAATAKRMSVEQREEWRFLKEAAAGSRFEAEAARMALGKSSNPAIREFAASLINHHASASVELLHMLHARGMAAPMLRNDQRKTLNQLAKLQGAKFDHQFMEEVGLRYQQDDVLYLEKASLAAREPRLRSWISRNLQTVRYHLATAERIAPPEARLARVTPAAASIKRASTQAAVPEAYVSRADLATRAMGGAPAVFGSGQLGLAQMGTPPAVMQLGVTHPQNLR